MRFACCVLILACPAMADDKKAELKGDAKALQGDWTFVSMSVDGEDQLKKMKDRGLSPAIEFKGMTMTMKVGPARPGKVTLDEKAKPKSMDLEIRAGNVVKTIYELKGDTLRICGPKARSGDRPKKFDGSAGSAQVLMVLKRKTKKDPAKKDAPKKKDSVKEPAPVK